MEEASMRSVKFFKQNSQVAVTDGEVTSDVSRYEMVEGFAGPTGQKAAGEVSLCH
jgi:hypothetical protein